jgi:transposase
MKTEGFSAHSKYMILQHALKEKNVSHTCKLFGISRTTFYNWHSMYHRFGMTGLKDKEPQKPNMPNQVNKKIEREILAYVQKYPEDGPKRICYELTAKGYSVGISGVYNVLKRNELSTKIKRRRYAHTKPLDKSISPPNLSFQKECPSIQEIKKPGDVVMQSIHFVGKFDLIGKVYQYTLYDVHSKLAIVKLYNRKQDIDIWHFFKCKLVYLLTTFHLQIGQLISIKTKEFTPYFVGSNQCKEMLEDLQISHQFIAYEENTLTKEIEAFNEFLVKAFYSQVRRDENIYTFVKLERALHHFLREYNFARPHSKGENTGKTPAEIVLRQATKNNVDFSTLPLWLLALINQLKGGEGNV